MNKKWLEGDKMIVILVFFGVLMITFVGVLITTLKMSDNCKHSYERIDTCNDKKMILVCRRCGKIRKLKK